MKHGVFKNHLANESSPYLLMHAHNPVDWYPWGDEALEKAKKENKLLIISIGYSACHWCHVMERECFEDEAVAEIMNKYYVSIKVDREERPDIDLVYMDALRVLTGSGGWPLNAIALPDGKPIFAGTYFPKDHWIELLKQIQKIVTENPEKIKQQAEVIVHDIQLADSVEINQVKTERSESQVDFNPEFFHYIFENSVNRMDFEWGGNKGSPKFPLPVESQFLLTYYYLTKNEKALEAVRVTLDKMAMGGIYDQIGGGFARYSTDSHWKVPHFEKMLYDNSQLVSLYCHAYQITHDMMYKDVVYQTLEFIERELTSPEINPGEYGLYSSIDADSEGEEGKFYVWTAREFQEVLGEDADIMMDYYGVDDKGNWKKGQNILWRNSKDSFFASSKKIPLEELREIVEKSRKKLFDAREKRERPGLDHKIITSWNATMITGYIDAYRVFNEQRFLDMGLKIAEYIVNHAMSEDGRLNRMIKNNRNEPGKEGISAVNGFLDDYTFTIEAFIGLYQATFDEVWLMRADRLMKYTLDHFYNKMSSMFYYMSDEDPALIARKMEIIDTVMPSSNSRHGLNLYLLGQYFCNLNYVEIAYRMLLNMKAKFVPGASFYAGWGILMSYFIFPPLEISIVGEDCDKKRKELDTHFLPNIILLGGKTDSQLPQMKGKYREGKTLIYLCRDKTCSLPQENISNLLLNMM